MGAVLLETLNGHKARIEGLLSNPNADQDLKDMLRDELQLTDKAIQAPSLPFVRNFERETEIEKVREKPGAAAAAVQPDPSKNIHGFSLKN